MRAIRQYEFGPPDVLRCKTVLDPVPSAGQVRIAVEAVGVHVIDTAIRRGEPGGPIPLPELPMTPGREVAGVVDRVAPDVDRSWLGRRAVAHLGQASGGYAELALADAARLHEIPWDVPARVAVAMIGTGRTAVGVLETAGLSADDTVVVTAAAGGLGSLFVQEGVTIGATVIGLAGGPDKVGRTRALGADVAVDYRRAGWLDDLHRRADAHRPTVVLDGVGGEIGRAVFGLLGRGGRLVRFGWSSGRAADIGADEFAARGVADLAVSGSQLIPRLPELEAAALARAARGAWRPLVQEFALAQAAAAHHAIETRATVGKVVLIPDREHRPQA